MGPVRRVRKLTYLFFMDEKQIYNEVFFIPLKSPCANARTSEAYSAEPNSKLTFHRNLNSKPLTGPPGKKTKFTHIDPLEEKNPILHQ